MAHTYGQRRPEVAVESSAASGVTSWDGRTGGVVPESGDFDVSEVTGAAPLANPTFTGTPEAPTASTGTDTTQLATTAFVINQIATIGVTGLATATPIVDGTGTVGVSTLAARQDHVHPTDTSRAPLASPNFTGIPAAPTAASGTNTTQLATTAFVITQIGTIGVTGLATATPIVDGTG